MKIINCGFVHFILGVYVFFVSYCQSMEFKKCDRVPENIRPDTKNEPVDNRFRMTIEGNPEGYIPEDLYTIHLSGSRVLGVYYKFIGFLLVVEKSTSNIQDGQSTAGTSGTFSLFRDNLSKFSEKCPNAVTQKSDILKGEIVVVWQAPKTGSGCVIFRATIMENRDKWYMDDPPLTKLFCEDEQDTAEKPSRIVDPCCACNEAKYELTFERFWSRHTHSKDFPSDSLSTRFSDIIGVSHRAHYHFWNYGEKASPGLKNLAEHRTTVDLENELKENSDKIRTFFRARGVSQRDPSAKTYAVFRTDSVHHLISLVSAIDPSPDWIVGVSDVELCNWNCTWIDYKRLNLYPWDVGTDSGMSYTSPDEPTISADITRRLTTSYPKDDKSPFFDASGADMKAMARLHIKLQRIYIKPCGEQPTPEEQPSACKVSPWGSWSKCSGVCGETGKQRRQRVYIDPVKATSMGCLKSLEEIKECTGSEDNCQGQRPSQPYQGFSSKKMYIPYQSLRSAQCALTDWTRWSQCSNKCGQGLKIRRRSYINPMEREQCQQGVMRPPILRETEDCNEFSGCIGDINPTADDKCPTTEWSEYSSCTQTCGHGIQFRKRSLLHKAYSRSSVEECAHVKLNEERICGLNNPQCEDIGGTNQQIPPHCLLDPDFGNCQQVQSNKWAYNRHKNTCALFPYSNCGGDIYRVLVAVMHANKYILSR